LWRSAEVFLFCLDRQTLWKGAGRPTRDEAVLKLLNGVFKN